MSSGNEDPYERLVALIKRVTDQKNARAALSLHLGKGERYSTNLFSAKFSMPVPALFEISDFYQIPASWMMDRAAPMAPPLPEDQLLLECEDSKLPAHDFLDYIIGRLSGLENLSVEKVDGLCCHRPVLEEIEEERFVDRHSAQAKTEALAEVLLRELLAARPGPLPSRRLGELAATLGLWAAIQRSRGLRSLAVKTLIAAFPLARRSGHAWSQASCLQRASYLIYTLGRPDLACGLLDQALWKYLESNAHLELKRLFVDRGAFLSTLPRGSEEAIQAYLHALEILPESEWRNRASALQGLSVNFHLLGETDKALLYAREAEATCIGESYILGCVKWREGAILFDIEQFGPAKAAIREALHLLGRFSNAGDIALVSLDYAEALIRADHLQEANLLIEDVTRWLPELRLNPMLHRALSRFVDLARIGELKLAEVAHTRQAVLAAQNGSQESSLAVR